MTRTLGILGGMGPVATTAFIARLQALTPAVRDEDHTRLLVDLNPHVPNRHSEPEAAGETLAAMAVGLRTAGAEMLAMPCNTAHAHAAAIVEASGLPLIDMIDETIVAAYATKARAVGVLGTGAGRSLYADRLRSGRAVLLDDADQAAFMALIFRIKAGETGEAARADMRGFGDLLIAAGAEVVIAGCTEIPLVLDAGAIAAPLIDSAEELARACVVACRNTP